MAYRPPQARARAGTASPDKSKGTGPVNFTNPWTSGGNSHSRRQTAHAQNHPGGGIGEVDPNDFAQPSSRWSALSREARPGSTFSQGSGSSSGPGEHWTQRGNGVSSGSGLGVIHEGATPNHPGFHQPAGPIINIRLDRERPGSNPLTPSFVPNSHLQVIDSAVWFNTTLRALAGSTFVMESGADVQYLKTFLRAEQRFPHVQRAVTKVAFPKFYWFSGVNSNRSQNPYIVTAAHMSFLEEITLGFHTAGLTCSVFGEKERLKIEMTDLVKSKELRPLSCQDIVIKYGLLGLLACPRLQAVHLNCIDSDMVAYYCKISNPTNVVHELAEWIKDDSKRRCGKQVVVTVGFMGANDGQ